MYDHISIVVYLLSKGANPNVQDIYGLTPLHMAVTPECLAILLVNGKADCSTCDHLGRTVLHHCCENGRSQCVEFLLEFGMSSAAVDRSGRTSLHIACSYSSQQCIVSLLRADKSCIDHKDKNGWTPLHLAAGRFDLMGAVTLLRHGADPNIRDTYHRTALHIA
ncbi:unnamed protein product, partial [Ectocarpus fasciculatus]